MKYYILLFAIFIFSISYSQTTNDFIITYELNNSTGLYVTYPFYGNNFTIDLGDGNTLTNNDVTTSGIHHTYAAPGTYTIVVSGDINRVNFNGGLGYYMNQKVKSIEQWGTAQWISMENAFSGLQNLTINATDVPDLSLVTNMDSMFKGCQLLNSSLNNWDVSNVTSMKRLFREFTNYNQPLNNWNVSNVTNMDEMFARAKSFNQNINSWDVSSVNSMIDMFGCFQGDYSSFNQPLNNWNVANVTNMYWMFRNAVSFNQPLNNWNVAHVVEFGYMFLNASSFNQNINSWNTSNVMSTQGMFQGASSFNEPLNEWVMSNNSNIREMFKDATSFNQPLNNWDTSSVIIMKGVFHNASSFNQDISDWNFENVIDFTSGFTNESFIGYTSMDTDNYDALLLALAQSGLQNKWLLAFEIEYCDTQVRSYLENQAGWSIYGDHLSNNCVDYSISGTVLFDIDNNGCDNNDIPVSEILVNATSNNFDYGTIIINGNYLIEANQGLFDINVINLPNYFESNPITATSTLDNTNPTDIIDFCLTAIESVEDLNITILPLNDARPGFASNYKLVIKNVGTEIINSVLTTFTFDNTKQSFISANPNETSILSNSINFNIGTILPFESIEILIMMQNFTTPTVNANDILNFSGLVTPNSNDYTPSDNLYEFEQIVVNAFDPNDKRVLQGESITLAQKDDYLDYIIRFQNIGNANATFIRIEDELDTELDWSTFKMVSASHDYQVNIMNGNEVEFLFNNINLPYLAVDEINSKGYIAFKIKPKATIQIGDVMSGNASIYFDYNPPIITNIVSTEVTDSLNLNEYSFETQVKIYPNPTNEYFIIDKSLNVIIESIELYDVSGKFLKEFSKSEKYIISKLNSGIYFLKIKTNQSETTTKLLKL